MNNRTSILNLRFKMLTNPLRILSADDGWVKWIECVEMELDEPDESGRRSPVVKAAALDVYLKSK